MKRTAAGAVTPVNPTTYIVQATNLTSREIYLYPDGKQESVLRGIYLEIKRGECWGVIGKEPFETELLMEIIGNVRPYGSGRCVLVERGMMRKKRRILPHVFYISGWETVLTNMNTLEYLMYVTSHFDYPAAQRQAAILEMLLDTNLYHLTLVPIKYLSNAEKAVICLAAASLSNALLVIFSVAELTFNDRLNQGIRALGNNITSRGGALLIGSGDCDMVQAACSHAAFLIDGKFTQRGTIDDMLMYLDKRTFILTADKPEQLAAALRQLWPGFALRVFDNQVHVYDHTPKPVTETELLALLLKAGQRIEAIQTSHRTLKNAYQEVLAGHDL